ncbi:MAG: hypothetical protein LAQ30_00525 [Acidobacteriia bacterium]|nr:hypothetical protein [Terriglobia bacterium]
MSVRPSSIARQFRTLWTGVRANGFSHTAGYVRSRVRDAYKVYVDGSFDRRYGTDTAGWVDLTDLTCVGAGGIEQSIYYEATAEPIFYQLFGALPKLEYEKFTFVDYGSGKGRILLLAAQHPFRAVTGVEFAVELHETALRNFERYRNPKQKCFALSSVLMDAADYDPPDGPCVFMFHSPFRRPLLTPIIERIKRSIRENPREAYLIYYGTIPDCVEYILNCGIPCREIQLQHHYTERTQTRRAFLLTAAPAARSQPAC